MTEREKQLRDVYDKRTTVAKRSHRRWRAAKMRFRRATKWWHRRKAQKAKAKRRLNRYLDEHNSTARERVVAKALDMVGITERPGTPNQDGGIIDTMNRAVGMAPSIYAYWCGSFTHWVLKWGGLDFPDWMRYTPTVHTYAQQRKYGLSIRPISELEPGDLVLMNFDGGVVDHIALYIGDGETVEGNTSPGTGGSQNNGGGIYHRSPRGVAIGVHVNYSEAPKRVKGEEHH